MIHGGASSLSPGVDQFLARLSPNGQPEGRGAFPERVDQALLRFQGTETVKQWYDRCVAAFMPEGIHAWSLEENLAAFAILTWRPDNELNFVTINVLKTECSLKDYLDLTDDDLKDADFKELSQPKYLRLDLDYGTLGPIGTHPLPHIHIGSHDSPRCALDASQSTNIVVDFIEFVYRHFFPEQWLAWAERAWNRRYQRLGRDPEQNPFRAIASAFAENEIGFLRESSKDIADLLRVLQDEKNDLFPLRMNPVDRQLMTFPDWHG